MISDSSTHGDISARLNENSESRGVGHGFHLLRDAGRPHWFRFRTHVLLRFTNPLPLNVEFQDSDTGRMVLVTLSREVTPDTRTKPPHVEFANLRTYNADGNVTMASEEGLTLDEKALEKFIRTYGLLRGYELAPSRVPLNREPISEIAAFQLTLRRAWQAWSASNAKFPLVEVRFKKAYQNRNFNEAYQNRANLWGFLEEMLKGFRVGFTVLDPVAELSVSADDLWRFILLLFSISAGEGKIGFCANPGCPAPYFIKKRKPQKFCELGSCTAYAARLYTNRWYDAKGKKQRADKRAKQRKRRRSKR